MGNPKGRFVRSKVEYARPIEAPTRTAEHPSPQLVLSRPRFVNGPIRKGEELIKVQKQDVVSAFIEAGGSYGRAARLLDLDATDFWASSSDSI